VIWCINHYIVNIAGGGCGYYGNVYIGFFVKEAHFLRSIANDPRIRVELSIYNHEDSHRYEQPRHFTSIHHYQWSKHRRITYNKEEDCTIQNIMQAVEVRDTICQVLHEKIKEEREVLDIVEENYYRNLNR
jgi:hypothetical protein